MAMMPEWVILLLLPFGFAALFTAVVLCKPRRTTDADLAKAAQNWQETRAKFIREHPECGVFAPEDEDRKK